MASFHQPGPIGDAIDGALDSGVLARALAVRPGVIGSAALRTDAGHVAFEVRHPWIAIDLNEGLPEVDAAEARYGLVRIVPAREPDHGYVVLVFETAAALRDATSKLAEHPEGSAALRAMSGLVGPALAAWLTERLESDRLKILWRRRSPFVIAEAPPEPPPPPVARRAATPSTPSAEYTTFPSGFDVATGVAALRQAAQDGVPFCEECMKSGPAAGDAGAGSH